MGGKIITKLINYLKEMEIFRKIEKLPQTPGIKFSLFIHSLDLQILQKRILYLSHFISKLISFNNSLFSGKTKIKNTYLQLFIYKNTTNGRNFLCCI